MFHCEQTCKGFKSSLTPIRKNSQLRGGGRLSQFAIQGKIDTLDGGESTEWLLRYKDAAREELRIIDGREGK